MTEITKNKFNIGDLIQYSENSLQCTGIIIRFDYHDSIQEYQYWVKVYKANFAGLKYYSLPINFKL